jgi:NAD(P)-dependent dehydrogenase (short-subunit alcohol dehydrogenase family)
VTRGQRLPSGAPNRRDCGDRRSSTEAREASAAWAACGGADTPVGRRATVDGCGRHRTGRLGTVEDITNLVLFLASDESAYCTGAEFLIDGGMQAGDLMLMPPKRS